ncbi:MAG: hypothetical protein HRF52_14735 [Ignavibacterium sp.]|uniref:hypothetical protein n=1 Tax=Ignavibacterium sp. TaxID=2651167 RepID=UPI003298BF5F
MTTKQEVKSKFEEWLEKQPDDVKGLIQERFESLENTVKATRGERDTLKKELAELAKKVSEDTEAGKQLGELRAKLESIERKANFFESSAKYGVTRPNVAYALAISENLFTENGIPDWEKIKESVPEIFRASYTKNNAGSGTAHALPDRNPNQIIREAAKNSNK